MAFTFSDLQNEVKRRATLDQGGTQFDTAINNAINTSLFRIAREANWRVLRRSDTFDTVTKYTTGSGGGTFTKDSKSVTMTNATLLTDNIRIGRRVTLQGSSNVFTIVTITGETTFTIDKNYANTTITSTGTYEILPQEEYVLPVQCTDKVFLWHDEFSTPYQLVYIPEQEFVTVGLRPSTKGTPLAYRMWGTDMVDRQPVEASAITISSSVDADTSVDVTVFGTVSSYPDFEIITTNASTATTAVAGSKSFTNVDRIVKNKTTTGRITCTSNSANVTVATLPVGDTTAGIMLRKVQIYPIPDSVFPVNVLFYKEPYRLVGTGDVHELGQDFDEAVILLSVAKIKYQQNQDEGDKFISFYLDEIRSLKKTNADKIDWFPTLGRGNRRSMGQFVHPFLRTSQVGANFGLRGR